MHPGQIPPRGTSALPPSHASLRDDYDDARPATGLGRPESAFSEDSSQTMPEVSHIPSLLDAASDYHQISAMPNAAAASQLDVARQPLTKAMLTVSRAAPSPAPSIHHGPISEVFEDEDTACARSLAGSCDELRDSAVADSTSISGSLNRRGPAAVKHAPSSARQEDRVALVSMFRQQQRWRHDSHQSSDLAHSEPRPGGKGTGTLPLRSQMTSPISRSSACSHLRSATANRGSYVALIGLSGAIHAHDSIDVSANLVRGLAGHAPRLRASNPVEGQAQIASAPSASPRLGEAGVAEESVEESDGLSVFNMEACEGQLAAESSDDNHGPHSYHAPAAAGSELLGVESNYPQSVTRGMSGYEWDSIV